MLPPIRPLLRALIAGAPAPNGQIAFYRYDENVDANVIFTVNPDGTACIQILDIGARANPLGVTH